MLAIFLKVHANLLKKDILLKGAEGKDIVKNQLGYYTTGLTKQLHFFPCKDGKNGTPWTTDETCHSKEEDLTEDTTGSK